MKPLTLRLVEFGPFRQLSLDFAELKDRTFFLIHGQTGAGKTTLLDAMTFALYGETSGNERKPEQMRNTEADRKVRSEVEFTFAIGPRRFRVRRKPQFKPETARAPRPSEAELAELLGNGKERSLAAKVGEVDDEVAKLLGFRADQFRQVILLPQGRFRELLTASSTERERILQTLFNTHIWKAVEDKLAEHARGMRGERDRLQARIAATLESAFASTDAELAERIETQAVRMSQLLAERPLLQVAFSKASQQLQAGLDAAKRLHERDESARALVAVQTQEPAVDLLRAEVAAAERAGRIAPADQQHRQALNRVKESQAALKAGEMNLAGATARKTEALAAQTKAAGRQPELAALRTQSADLEARRPKVEQLASAAAEHAAALAEVKKATAALEQAKSALASATARRQALQQQISQSTAAAAEKSGRLAAVEKSRKLLIDREALGKLQPQLAAQEQAVAKAQKELQQAEADQRQAAAQLETAQAKWDASQAAVLAARLEPGKPCPVCGSTDHPAPAHGDDNQPSEKTIRDLRQRSTDGARRQQELSSRIPGLTAQAAKLQSQVDATMSSLGAAAESSADTLRKLLAEAEASLKASTDAESAMAGLQRQSLEAETAEATAAKAVEEAGQQRSQREVEAGAKLSTLRGLEADVPEALRPPGALASAAKAIEEKIRSIEQAIEATGKAVAEAESRQAGAEATRLGAAEALTREQTALAQAVAELREAVQREQFSSIESYRAAIRDGTQLGALKEKIAAFDRALAAARDRCDRAEAAAKDLETPDLEALRMAAEAAKQQIESAESMGGHFAAQMKSLKECAKRLSKLRQEEQELDVRYGVLGKVADVVAGKGDTQVKISLQRFVLSFLLDDVLAAASARLHAMSSGRYKLQRQLDPQNRRSGTGLDLDVLDQWHGEARPVATLSGGESFLAALALALGLADVVQGYAGGVRMETMFIDEGFGSLDPESLDSAIRNLMDLMKDGRLVGVISHVPELRERIDARLEVARNRTGSTARFVVS